MPELDDLIKFENENTSLDFKAIQYTKTPFEALIKDIMSMANANVPGDRYIIVGVKHHPDGTREYLSIAESEFMDSATYHQLLKENVEPEIKFDYLPHHFEGALLGIFRIYDCNDQPYMMRKAYANLKQGDAYIRKGSHQTRLMRPDIDRMFLKRSERGFTGTIKIGFDAPGTPKELNLPSTGKVKLPSDLAAETIRSILAEREKPAHGEMAMVRRLLEAGALGGSFLRPTPYAQRSTDELRKNLENVKDIYRDDDLYELYEVNGTKINLSIVNEGETYVEDASIHVEIEKHDDLRVAPRIYPKPDRSDSLIHYAMPPLIKGRTYPATKNYKKHIEVSALIGNLRHGIPTQVFAEPLRIVIENNLIGQKIYLRCKLFGKQLKTPRAETLTINVIEPIAKDDTAE